MKSVPDASTLPIRYESATRAFMSRRPPSSSVQATSDRSGDGRAEHDILQGAPGAMMLDHGRAKSTMQVSCSLQV
eukprot:scaffold128533_cov37-Tisochrysis_lutea.AAC.2